MYLRGTSDSGVTATKSDPGKGLSDYWVIHLRVDESATGLDQPQDRALFAEVFPNPAVGQVTVRFISGPNPPAIFRMRDVPGREVYFRPVAKGETRLVVDVSSMSRGLYFWEAGSETGRRETGKLVVSGQ